MHLKRQKKSRKETLDSARRETTRAKYKQLLDRSERYTVRETRVSGVRKSDPEKARKPKRVPR